MMSNFISKTFYVGFIVAVAFAALLALPSSTFGQIITIRGFIIINEVDTERTWYANYDSVNTARVNDGYVREFFEGQNYYTYSYGLLQNYGTITNAIADSTTNPGYLASVQNEANIWNYGTIANATVNNGGVVCNESGGGIGYLTINSGGELTNRGNGTIGTVVITGGTLSNSGTIGTATVNSGRLRNGSSGTITDAMVNGGTLENYGMITTATVNNGGVVYNESGGGIGYLTINSSGELTNRGNGTIGTVVITVGTLSNSGTIGTATVNGGRLYNYSSITNAMINGGTLYNNNSNSIIGTATQTSGTVSNGGRIENMTYVAGTYNGRYINANGTVRKLTLAGDAANNTGDWGNIENLAFDNGGNGLITLIASANPAMAMAAAFDGLLPANAALQDISFYSNITAQNIDFTYGNIALDLSSFGTFGETDTSFLSMFSLSGLFGGATVEGTLDSFALTWDKNYFFVLNEGVLANGWDFTNGFVTWDGTAIDWNSAEVPEPATLLMLGLAVAGLPVVRRLRKR